MIKIPSGFKSSEFYLSLVGSIVGISIMLGYITPEQGKNLEAQLKLFIDALEVGFGALLAIVSTVAYIYSRLKLKQTAIQASTKETALLNAEPTQPQTKGTPLKSASPSYIVE